MDSTELIYLTAEELQSITARKRIKLQIEWLLENGFTVKRRADGSPLVSRAHFLQVMGNVNTKRQQRGETPNFSSLE